MEFVVAVGFLIAVVVAFNVGAKAATSSAKAIFDRAQIAQAQDRKNFLTTLRRELANLLVWHDPVRFQQLYQVVLAETAGFKDLTAEGAQQRLDALSAKYPNYEDFDIVGTRPYVLYPDAISMHDWDALEQAYRDIANFQAIMIARDPHWKFFLVATGEEAEHLAKYVRKVQDTKLRLDIERAVNEYYVATRNSNERADYDSREFTVRPISHFAENRLGILVKATNEHGLYGFFVSDTVQPDGSPKIYHSYYRSDATFQAEDHLDYLHEVANWRRSPSGRGGV